MKKLSVFFSFCFLLCTFYSLNAQGHSVADEGAWCWFADPRALHYENAAQNINATYIGYIDVHGNIKATQHNFLTGETSEVLVRSYFQPDDHDNPTFLALPDGRVMIFYSRHTDEACFYYRISKNSGDITALGEEKKLITANNTTYPSPFILANDPNHIYLCWRGINWHPTIARLTMPDNNDNVSFDWGPKQIVQSTGARPYAKYYSNGTDKIYLTYTTGHPDNESPNWIYFNYINITGTDATQITLSDAGGTTLSTINAGVHNVNKTDAYISSYPNAVVDNAAYRDWVWQVAPDAAGNPVIAMVRINAAKTQHDYYYARWNGSAWVKTFLASGGGHFHQTAGLEMCYSGGMAIDALNPSSVYCSVPVNGVYEIVKYTVTSANTVTSEPVTQNSAKNNVRPYIIPNAAGNLRLVWMYGDYYDWIVSSTRPQGYPTAIYSDYNLYPTAATLPAPAVREVFADGSGNLAAATDNVTVAASASGDFSISLLLSIDNNNYGGRFFQAGDFSYNLDASTLKPFVQKGTATYPGTNVFGNSDVWQTQSRGTGGQWYAATKFAWVSLAFTYSDGILTTFINGLIDQKLEISGITFSSLVVGGFVGTVADCRVYNSALTQNQIKLLVAENETSLALHELDNIDIPALIYTDIVLPAQTASGVPLLWASSDMAVLSNTGLVTLPQSPVNVALTATMGDSTKTFQTTVMPRNIQKNIVLHYSFDTADRYESGGVAYLADKGERGNDARIYGSAQINGSLDLTQNTNTGFSTNGYLIAPAGLLASLRSYSFLLKTNLTRKDRLPRFYDFGSGTGNSVFGRVEALSAGFKYNGGTTVLVNSPQAIATNQDTYLAFTFDAATHTTKIYINAQETVSSTSIAYEPYQLAALAEDAQNYIGRTQWTNGDNVDFCGTMDDFYLFDIALTQPEIQNLQTEGNTVQLMEVETQEQCLLYPNPLKVGEKMTIALPEALNKNACLQIFSAEGREVFSNVAYIAQTYRMPASFSQGFYLLKLQTDNRVFYNKFIIN